MVLVEALACGTPVVSTGCGGPEDIVNDRVGVLVPPENPQALARGIEHVLDHQADYDKALLLAHALENFGLESVGRRLEKVYRDVVGSSRRESPAPVVAGGLIAG
jgi:glycosyltransferase involved in cell wall biosynthesis